MRVVTTYGMSETAGGCVYDGVPLDGNQSRSPYARVDGNPVPVNQRPLGLTRSISAGFLKTFKVWTDEVVGGNHGEQWRGDRVRRYDEALVSVSDAWQEG